MNFAQRLLILIAFCVSFVFSACKKDVTETSNTEICDTLVCQNGGQCLDGICECPEGYGGYDCSDLILPDWIELDCVEVFKFDQMNGTNSWDDGELGIDTLPDLFFGCGQDVGPTSNYVEGDWFYNGQIAAFNATSSQSYIFQRDHAMIFPLMEGQGIQGYDYECINISILDLDTSTSPGAAVYETMGSIIYQDLGNHYISNLPSYLIYENSYIGVRIFPKFHWD